MIFSYWFFIPLFICYLTIPILAYLPDDKKKNILIYIATIMFILNSLIPFILMLLNNPIDFPLKLTDGNFSFFNGFMFYVIVGNLLHKYDMSRKFKVLLYILS